MKKNPEKLNKIIIPKKGDEKTRQDLIDDLNSLSDDDIMKMGEEFEKANKKPETPQEIKEHYNVIGEIKEIGGKPAFRAKNKDGKEAVFWGDEQCCEWVDAVFDPVDILGKPVFYAENNGKWRVSQGKEQLTAWFDNISYLMEIGGQPVLCEKNEYWKLRVFRGMEMCCGWVDKINELQDIGGKPAFLAKRDDSECVFRGDEKYKYDFDKIW